MIITLFNSVPILIYILLVSLFLPKHSRSLETFLVQDNIAHAEMPSSLPHVNTPCSTTDNELESEKKIADGESRGWQLTLDESANEEIRKYFCFDQVS